MVRAARSPSSGKNISLANTVQIVRATGRPNLLAMAAGACGYWVGTPEDRALAELGRLTMEIREREARVRELCREVA